MNDKIELKEHFAIDLTIEDSPVYAYPRGLGASEGAVARLRATAPSRDRSDHVRLPARIDAVSDVAPTANRSGRGVVAKNRTAWVASSFAKNSLAAQGQMQSQRVPRGGS
ncbi:hypothetical protein PQQ51_04395 [Paraburkholderia xenovorans]|uniref:hypothetical protein n=1 Tax=Paraburkholderia xenovorans TaxID=36873 RepID=UPI0038B6CE9B